MRHTRKEVIERTIREYKLLDKLVGGLKPEDWKRPVPRPETKDPWTVKDSLAHITYWKADTARSARGLKRPSEFLGLNETEENRLIYMRWKKKSPREVLEWHRRVHNDVLKALREAPEKWFTGKPRRKDWPYDVDAHLAYHRIQDIESVLEKTRGKK